MTIDKLNQGETCCPRCGASFTCEFNTHGHPCWCTQVANVMPLPGNANQAGAPVSSACLCPRCLIDEVTIRACIAGSSAASES